MSVFAMMVAAAAIPTTPDCASFDNRAVEPMNIAAEALPSTKIGALPQPLRPGTIPRFKVGPLNYSGYGIVLRSADPRFRAIRFDASDGLYHPCGYRVEGASPWDVRDGKIRASELHFVPLRSDQTVDADPRTPAAIQGVESVLAGYKPGPNWSIYKSDGSFFIGLMYPIGRSGETAIVAFPKTQGRAAAHLLASVPIDLDALSALPYPHGGALALSLEGRQRDGSIDYFILDLSNAEEETIAKSLAPSAP